MHRIFERIVDRLLLEEYVMCRRLGYSATDAMLQAMLVRDDFRRMASSAIKKWVG